MSYENYKIAVLVPCFNEERTVAEVVTSFREQLPHAQIYVYDNNSTDGTAERARKAGAIVRRERQQGKGNVIRQMFADIDADIYVMADGDGQHLASDVNGLIAALVEGHTDMVVGTRRDEDREQQAHHGSGNKLFNRLVTFLFRQGMHDIFSGYRVFSRRFVKSFPCVSRGFEIETELSVHALELRIPFIEVPIDCRMRPEGSVSKLNTYKDGLRILATVVRLFREARPFALFSTMAVMLVVLSLVLGYPLVTTFLETRTVPRFPTAIIVMGLLASSFVAFASGVILQGIAQLRRENKRLHYLHLSGIQR